MKSYFIEKSNLIRFFENINREYDLYVPKRHNDDLYYERFDSGSAQDIAFGEYRPVEPVKSFLHQGKETIATYFGEGEPAKKKPKAIFGVKNCDLASLKVQDHVFKDSDFEDPTYCANRDSSLLISADCTSFKPVCYCAHLGVAPYPTEGFDLNISDLGEAFIVDAGTPRGEALIQRNIGLFKEATADALARRETKRKEVEDKLKLSVSEMGLPQAEGLRNLVTKGVSSEVWERFAETCVECGACTHGCPTCHCFLIYDERGHGGFVRKRIWDSCQYLGFARVAGGANPRPELAARLRNRYVKKFDYFSEVLGSYACTGCGRCIEACLGKIDMREVFKELTK